MGERCQGELLLTAVQALEKGHGRSKVISHQFKVEYKARHRGTHL